jgi:hypothetical protein
MTKSTYRRSARRDRTGLCIIATSASHPNRNSRIASCKLSVTAIRSPSFTPGPTSSTRRLDMNSNFRDRVDLHPNAFRHSRETDCVAGVVGLELRNPLGSKSARSAGEFLPFGRNGPAETVRVRAAALPTCSCGKDFEWHCGCAMVNSMAAGCSICPAGMIRTSSSRNSSCRRLSSAGRRPKLGAIAFCLAKRDKIEPKHYRCSHDADGNSHRLRREKQSPMQAPWTDLMGP